MVLEKIITLANQGARLRFLALERSLRATGCELPVWVIPYDDDKFELPKNCHWWEKQEITTWLKKHKAHPMMRKYHCLTEKNYQFVDSDVIFLVNPEIALRDLDGFITSCGHWHNPGHTYTKESLPILKSKSSLWQKFVFNAGQFACDTVLYSIDELKSTAESELYRYTCLQLPYHDQPGMNLLVNSRPVHIQNITLPPYNMESTWAGDYETTDYSKYWLGKKKPYLIHWAGCKMDNKRPIDELFFNFMSESEKQEWNKQLKDKKAREKTTVRYYLNLARKLKKSFGF